MRLLINLSIFLITFASCNNYKTKYPYSLSDFRPELREHLEKIVQLGYTYSEFDEKTYSYLDNHSTIKELTQLTYSEHPILRAVSFGFLCRRENFNVDKILLAHLDDTAFIHEDNDRQLSVADHYLYSSENHTTIPKTELIDRVITDHNYLIHAYYFLCGQKENNEKYYPIIKNILNRERWIPYQYEMKLLNALSKYKKQNDKNFIAGKLYNSGRRHSEERFQIISGDPDTAYFKVIEQYYKGLLFSYKRGELQRTFNYNYNSEQEFKSFLSAVAAYKNKKSVEIFTQIINKKLYPQYSGAEQIMLYKVYSILQVNPDKVYNNLMRSLKPAYEKYKKKEL